MRVLFPHPNRVVPDIFGTIQYPPSALQYHGPWCVKKVREGTATNFTFFHRLGFAKLHAAWASETL